MTAAQDQQREEAALICKAYAILAQESAARSHWYAAGDLRRGHLDGAKFWQERARSRANDAMAELTHLLMLQRKGTAI